jgi:TonB family protein
MMAVAAVGIAILGGGGYYAFSGSKAAPAPAAPAQQSGTAAANPASQPGNPPSQAPNPGNPVQTAAGGAPVAPGQATRPGSPAGSAQTSVSPQRLPPQPAQPPVRQPDAAPQTTSRAGGATPAGGGNPAQPIHAGDVQQAQLVRQVPPTYPPMAKQARVTGLVRLKVVVGKDGAVKEATLISGHPLLVAAAMSAARQWVYRPTLLNGQPVEVLTEADVNFTLGGSEPAPPRETSQAAAPPPPPPRQPSLPPPTPQPQATARYTGPSSGTLTWSGALKKNLLVVVEGNQATEGSVMGSLPGVPVTVQVDTKDVALVDSPGPGGGWKKLSFRSTKNMNSVVVIRWRLP